MPHCPICETEYFEGQDKDNCFTCNWNLSLVSVEDKTAQDVLDIVIAWAREMWQKQKLVQVQQISQSQSEARSKLKFFEEQLRKITERVHILEQFEQQYQQSNLEIQESIKGQEQLKSQLEKIVSEHHSEHQNNSQIFSRIEGEINNIKNDFQKQLTSSKTDYNKQLQEQFSQIESNANEQIHPLQTRLEDIEDYLENYLKGNQVNAQDTNTYQSKSEIFTKRPLSLEEHKLEKKLVKEYNQNLDLPFLLTKIIEVSETQKSISDRSAGASQTVTLEEKPRGMYGIVTQGNYHYLVPSKSFRITDNNYKTVQALFKCSGYQRGHSERFELIQPAKVSSRSSNQQWQLEEPGILEFI